MPKSPRKTDPIIAAAETVAGILVGFDYEVERDDFVLYELTRLINEERASFDDPEFRALIDEGIRGHIEEKPAIRAGLAERLRSASLSGPAQTVARRVVHAVEDLQADLCNVAVLVRSYTAYLLGRLESEETALEDERLTMAADLLFESTGDRDAAETALSVLCSVNSSVAARILAHAVSEPLLDEDLELRAIEALKKLWPMPRRFMLYNLQGHMHEDLPLRWFQLFVEMDELNSVDLTLEELRAHGERPEHREDLSTLLTLLRKCRDPELEDKILGSLNMQDASAAMRELLGQFLEEYRPANNDSSRMWTERSMVVELNRQYIGAAADFERGDFETCRKGLDGILAMDPRHALASMLKALLPGTHSS